MNKLVFLLILLLITVVYIFKKDRLLSDNYPIINDIKALYIEKAIDLESVIQKYFQQTRTIETLKTQNQALIQYQSLYQSTKSTLESLKQTLPNIHQTVENIQLSKVISYVELNDFTKVWLDLKKENMQIDGLIDGEFSAGIVINKSGFAQGLLNGNEKCNYAVFVGEEKAPGITHAHVNKEFITIKFIPIWINIEIGDEVITSGMDNIFFEGLKVGKVVDIKKMADIQEATVKPYANVLNKKYFYIYSHKNKESNESTTVNTEIK